MPRNPFIHPYPLRAFSLSLLLVLLSGCSGIPFLGKKDKGCEYRIVYSVARVKSVEAGSVDFEISGYRNQTKSLDELSGAFEYIAGKEFQVRQKFLEEGDCEPYVMEILREL